MTGRESELQVHGRGVGVRFEWSWMRPNWREEEWGDKGRAGKSTVSSYNRFCTYVENVLVPLLIIFDIRI